MRLIILLAAMLWGMTEAKAQCDFPVPDFKISEYETSGISKTSFDMAMNKFEGVYAPIFQAQGCPLVLHRSWSDGTVNAQAWQDYGHCHIEMFGGFARYPGITSNAMLAIACHEAGHHLGGFPFYAGDNMSVEGQSDYYATLTCMKRLGVPSAAASLAVATALARLRGLRPPSRSTRDTSVVSRTQQSHPKPQCRLDTMDAGRLNQARPRCWFAP